MVLDRSEVSLMGENMELFSTMLVGLFRSSTLSMKILSKVNFAKRIKFEHLQKKKNEHGLFCPILFFTSALVQVVIENCSLHQSFL